MKNQHINKWNINSNTENRIEFIDLAKGVCILLVVTLHCRYDIPNFKAIRMPLYFLLSGLFFRDYSNFLFFVVRKFNRMIVPLLFFTALCYILMVIVRHFTGAPVPNAELLYYPFIEGIYLNPPLWFLTCLFIVNILFWIIQKFTRKNTLLEILICLCCGLLGYFLSLQNITLPLCAAAALSALPFFCMGRIIAKTQFLYPNKYDRLTVLLGLAMVILSFGIHYLCGPQSINFIENQYLGIFPLILINSTLFTLGVLMLCKWIGHLPLVSYMGRYSIIILGIHYIVIILLPEITISLIGISEIDRIYPLVLSITLSLASIPLCRKYLPQFTAQKDLIKLRKKN